MTAVLVIGSFCVLLTAGTLWATEAVRQPERERHGADPGHAAVEYWPIYS